MRERLLFGLAVFGLLAAGAIAAAGVGLVDAEQVSAAVEGPEAAEAVALTDQGVPIRIDDAPCKYPDNCEPEEEPETVSLFIELTLSGMLSEGDEFAFAWSCNGSVGDRTITQTELLAGGGEVRIEVADTIETDGICQVAMTSAPTGWSQPAGFVFNVEDDDIEASFFSTDAG